jgi:drug/metabolite transporter (DMT)-like permease
MLSLLGGAAMISTSAVFVKLTSVPPTTSGFYRVFFGGIILGLLAWRRPESRPRGARAWTALLIAGVFFSLDLWFWHRSIHYVGPGLSTLLANFQVFVLALVGVLVFGEKLRLELVIAVPLALYGLSLIVGVDWQALSDEYRAGVVFGLLTAVSYAGYILSLRYTRTGGSGGSPGADLAVVSLCTAAFLAASALAEGASLAIPGWRDAGLLIGYGFVAQVLGWVLISRGLEGVAASRVGLVLLLQPLLAYVWDITFFSGPLAAPQLVGAGLTVFSIWLGSRRRI